MHVHTYNVVNVLWLSPPPLVFSKWLLHQSEEVEYSCTACSSKSATLSHQLARLPRFVASPSILFPQSKTLFSSLTLCVASLLTYQLLLSSTHLLIKGPHSITVPFRRAGAVPIMSQSVWLLLWQSVICVVRHSFVAKLPLTCRRHLCIWMWIVVVTLSGCRTFDGYLSYL